MSLLDPSLVPLHLVAGPALHVSTNNEETEGWILGCLLEGSAYPTRPLSSGRPCAWQSEVGVLLKVEGDAKSHHGSPGITELLLYASASKCPGSQAAPLTPPRSSSPTPGEEPIPLDHQFRADIKISALPLSSAIHNQLTTLPEPPTPPPEAQLQEGRFLDLSLGVSESRKRGRLDSLFDDATREIKRARRHGGETMAKIMANLEKPAKPLNGSSSSAQGSRQPEMQVRKRPKPPSVPPLVRSKSISSLQDFASSRPSNRGDPGLKAKRSTLSRVASTSQLGSPTLESPYSTIEQDNRNALSRIVMAGMRMYGLSQRKKSSRSRAGSELPLPNTEPPQAQAEEEDEYKLVYHQTYKAAAFAVRRQIGSMVLGQTVLRDIVDRLLAIFCSDPLGDPGDDGIATGKERVEDSVFDPPSQEACAGRCRSQPNEACSSK